MINSRNRERDILNQQVLELRALLVLSRNYNVRVRTDLDSVLEIAEAATKDKLRTLTDKVRLNLQRLCDELHPTQPIQFYVDLYKRLDGPTGQLLFLPKWQLKALFGGFEPANPGIELYPEHAQLGIDVHGSSLPTHRGEVRILEAALFEDVCMFFNQAWDLTRQVLQGTSDVKVIKQCAALRRTTILAAFYFVEAYLNSIAFDYHIANSDEMSPAIDKIAEWDHANDRERLVNFRDKLLQYPKIILGVAHPPIQESNCEPMRFLLETSKQMRDAVVHANPKPDARSVYGQKQLHFGYIGSAPATMYSPWLRLDQDQQDRDDPLLKTVDCAIDVVRRIETEIHPGLNRLFWLHSRGADGRFGDEVFA